MAVFLECRIIVGGQHLTVGVYIHACPFCLAEQLLHILHVMTADEDGGVVSYADIDL